MDNLSNLREKISRDGFVILEPIYNESDVNSILSVIKNSDTTEQDSRAQPGIIAIRRLLEVIPNCSDLLLNEKLLQIVTDIFGDGYFVVKSIYFDKPSESNWFVSYHQDLKISVSTKKEMDGYINWTKKEDQFSVQPPTEILSDNFTVRIHLDNTSKDNGALRVLPGTHLIGTPRAVQVLASNHREETCEVERGGVMLMRPLLFHSSGRTINQQRRRVVQIEFSRKNLPNDLKWSERRLLNSLQPTSALCKPG